MGKSSDSNLKYRVALAAILGLSLHSLVSTQVERRQLRALPNVNEARYLHETDSTLPPWAHFNLKSVHSAPDVGETPIFWHIPKVSPFMGMYLFSLSISFGSS